MKKKAAPVTVANLFAPGPSMPKARAPHVPTGPAMPDLFGGMTRTEAPARTASMFAPTPAKMTQQQLFPEALAGHPRQLGLGLGGAEGARVKAAQEAQAQRRLAMFDDDED